MNNRTQKSVQKYHNYSDIELISTDKMAEQTYPFDYEDDDESDSDEYVLARESPMEQKFPKFIPVNQYDVLKEMPQNNIVSLNHLHQLIRQDMICMKLFQQKELDSIKETLDFNMDSIQDLETNIKFLRKEIVKLRKAWRCHQGLNNRLKNRLAMGMLESVDELDSDQWETVVSVHSPVIRSNQKGHFTTYSVSLKSNNSCFSLPFSCVNRRYSEFIHLRNILKKHHPNIEPPSLPPKKLFRRFDQSFINERTEGLQTFMREVLNVAVYLSNRAVHLFLQSSCSISEINRHVSGNETSGVSSQNFDSCSDTSSEHTDGGNPLNDLDLTVEVSEDAERNFDEVGIEARDLIPATDELPVQPKIFSEPIPILQPYHRRTLKISGSGSNSASPHISPCSSSADSTLCISRHVSFCDKVKVAVVRDQFWNIGTRPIRTCAW